MGLWDFDESAVDIETESENVYLKDSAKGLELIAKILTNNKNNEEKKVIRQLDKLVDKSLLNSINRMNIQDELQYYNKLNQLSDKFNEHNKVQLLNNKTVIGVGGKFSAGKSKFINTILGDSILPEDQNPTTSIPTYIVYSEKNSVRAYTFNNNDVELDIEAAQAITHAFYEKHHLGFSQFINNMVIKNKNIPFKYLAILDTPGYSKHDSNSKKTVSDEQKAYEQLKTVDFLIWLVDIENGIIQKKDIDFIYKLNIEQPVLIVFNKADKKSENDIRDIVEKSKEILNKSHIKLYDVTAFSSYNNEEYLGKNTVQEFLVMCNNYRQGNENVAVQMKNITNSLEEQLLRIKSKSLEYRNFIGNIIFKSEDVLELKALTELYSDSIEEVKNINLCTKRFNNIKEKINKMLQEVVR